MLAGVLPRVYPQMLEVAWAHQDEGRPVYIVTAASHELAEMLAHVLSFDGGIGARSEIVEGRYTGRPHGPVHLPRGQGRGDPRPRRAGGHLLADSYAYSDSESDLPMMRAVGHPVAVNPDAPLAQVAREEGWEVMRFERLGRRLKIVAAAVAMAAAGGFGREVAARRVGPALARCPLVQPPPHQHATLARIK